MASYKGILSKRKKNGVLQGTFFFFFLQGENLKQDGVEECRNEFEQDGVEGCRNEFEQDGVGQFLFFFSSARELYERGNYC